LISSLYVPQVNYTFFLAMTLYPDIQKKAQAKIDRVIGPDRLPRLADRDRLPYTEALAKEVMRWQVVAPQGRSLLSDHLSTNLMDE
jgi:cytochrome P450